MVIRIQIGILNAHHTSLFKRNSFKKKHQLWACSIPTRTLLFTNDSLYKRTMELAFAHSYLLHTASSTCTLSNTSACQQPPNRILIYWHTYMYMCTYMHTYTYISTRHSIFNTRPFNHFRTPTTTKQNPHLELNHRVDLYLDVHHITVAFVLRYTSNSHRDLCTHLSNCLLMPTIIIQNTTLDVHCLVHLYYRVDVYLHTHHITVTFVSSHTTLPDRGLVGVG